MVEEARSCSYAVKSAFEFSAHTIILEGDCLFLIHRLKSSQVHDTFVGFYVRDILSFVKKFEFVSWSFVKRDGSRMTHDLAIDNLFV